VAAGASGRGRWVMLARNLNRLDVREVETVECMQEPFVTPVCSAARSRFVLEANSRSCSQQILPYCEPLEC
jgi:hypothetical protein